MSAYRSAEGIRAVCIVCFAFAARGAAVCPRCKVQMTSTGDEQGSAEVLKGLAARAQRRHARPNRQRNALVYGGSFGIAVVVTVVLMVIGIFDPKLDGSSGSLGEADVVFAFWPAVVLWFAFVVALTPLANRIFPDVSRPPETPTVDALAKYLAVEVVDESRDACPRVHE